MFCPLCKAEYREGFTRCKDCDVALVPLLPYTFSELCEPLETAGPALQRVWSGNDALFFGQIAFALREADIPCHVFSASEAVWTQMPTTTSRFEIRVFPGDQVAAERVIASLEKAKQAADELAEVQPQGNTEGSLEDVAIELTFSADAVTDQRDYHWKPDEATAEIWTGEDSAVAEFLRDALREHGIGYRTTCHGPTTQRILVRPVDTARAREVVRAIVEGANSD